MAITYDGELRTIDRDKISDRYQKILACKNRAALSQTDFATADKTYQDWLKSQPEYLAWIAAKATVAAECQELAAEIQNLEMEIKNIRACDLS